MSAAIAVSAFRNHLNEWLDEEALYLGSPAGEFDRAIIGFMTNREGNTVLAYDSELVIECLMANGMDREGAEEWFDFNIASAYMGEGTPLYIRTTRALSLFVDAKQ